MSALGAALILVLLAIAALHLYWGFGGYWPGHDAASLRGMVIGGRRAHMPGPAPSALVAAALATAACIVLWRQGRIAYGLQAWIVYGGYIVLILVFGLRGLAAYATHVFDYARNTPFFALNRRIYAPLCLAIATGLIADYPPGLFNLLRR